MLHCKGKWRFCMSLLLVAWSFGKLHQKSKIAPMAVTYNRKFWQKWWPHCTQNQCPEKDDEQAYHNCPLTYLQVLLFF
jgi:hypothetical protein